MVIVRKVEKEIKIRTMSEKIKKLMKEEEIGTDFLSIPEVKV